MSDNLQAGYTFCNPAWTDGRGLLSNEDYIKTCPERWHAALRGMKEIADQMYGPEGWRIRQIKTKFGEARVYLEVLSENGPTAEERTAMSSLEAFTETVIDRLIDRYGEE